MKGKLILNLLLVGFVFISCKKKEVPAEVPAKLNFSMEFDETLPRLGNFGEIVAVGEGNAAQHPKMDKVSLHYIEFAKDSLTPLGSGIVVYHGAETAAGGANAVDFDKAAVATEGINFITVDLSTLPPGTYNWLRVSITYQKYEIDFRYNNPPYFENADLTGTLASFVGFNTYITQHKIKDSIIVVNDDKLQGYWGFETFGSTMGVDFGSVSSGESAGVTVVNPISATSPVPEGSCVVTGKLAKPLVILGNETDDIDVVLAFSINNSLEWQEVNFDGKFEPGAGENIVDMGLRGLHPRIK